MSNLNNILSCKPLQRVSLKSKSLTFLLTKKQQQKQKTQHLCPLNKIRSKLFIELLTNVVK